jgi:peptidoglycan/LPS O-acetylase OafA/YrhL
MRPRRLPALDALRGIAALVVVAHHCVRVDPAFARGFDLPGEPLPGVARVVLRTPLHLLVAGPEAVFVFFVLSGFVLSRPWLAGYAPALRDYYPRRLLRLLPPVWGALLLAAALYLLVPAATVGGSAWVRGLQGPPPARAVLVGDVPLLGVVTTLDPPLWSLHYEMLFLLLLPALGACLPAVRRLAGLLAAGCLLVIWFGRTAQLGTLTYLPMLALGVALAAREARLPARPGGVRTLLPAAAGLLLLSAGWGWWPAPVGTLWWDGARVAAQAAGAGCLVVAACSLPADRRWLQWLGRRSYSLYLVHVPLLLAAQRLAPTGNAAVSLLTVLPLSLLVAEGFHRAVEAPATALARRWGRAAPVAVAVPAPRRPEPEEVRRRRPGWGAPDAVSRGR